MTSEEKKRVLPNDQNASGRSLAGEEMDLLREVLASGTLNCTRGSFVKAFEEQFAATIGCEFTRAVSSGTAAIHAAVAAVNPSPGDEIITSPITDMGAISPILFQTAIPVFADVDARSMNVTAQSISDRITKKTKAVIVTHLFGQPCDMDPIVELCKRHDIVLIEDAAQAFLARDRGRLVGSIGDIGCFSLQQGKHMTSGEGGIVTSSNKDLARHMRLFSDKAWGYGDPQPDHYFLALNYRMTELQGAVALAQLKKLPGMIDQRLAGAGQLTSALSDVPGISTPETRAGSLHVYWRFPIMVDSQIIKGGPDALAKRLQACGLACAPRYTRKLAFECAVIREQRTFGNSSFPYVGPHLGDKAPLVFERSMTPMAAKALDSVVVLPLNERMTEEDVDWMAQTIKACVSDVLQT